MGWNQIKYYSANYLAKVNAFPLAAKRLGDDVRELQVMGGELSILMPSVLDKAFKGEL